MDGHGHVVADAHNGSEGVGTETQMSIFTHDLEALAFLLHGIGVVAEAVNDDLGGLDLAGLTSALALDEDTLGADAGTGGDVLEGEGGGTVLDTGGNSHSGGIDDYLDVLDGGTIVESDEVHRLGRAMGTYPAHDGDFLPIFSAFQHFNYLCSFHFSFIVSGANGAYGANGT